MCNTSWQGDGKDNNNANNQQRIVKYNEWKFRVFCETSIPYTSMV